MSRSRITAGSRNAAGRGSKGEQVLDNLVNVASATNTIVGGFGKIPDSVIRRSFPYLLSTGGGILFALTAHITGLFVPVLADTFIVASTGGLGLIAGAIAARGRSGISTEAGIIAEITARAERYNALIEAATETGRLMQALPANTPKAIKDKIWAELGESFVKSVPALPGPALPAPEQSSE